MTFNTIPWNFTGNYIFFAFLIFLLQDGAEELILKISASPRKLDLTKPSKPAEKQPSNSKDHWVDKSSRVLFPTLYALFLLAYVVHYKSKD